MLTKIGTITQRATVGTTAITGVGFQPKAIIFWGIAAGANSSAGSLVVSMGMAVSPTSRAAIVSRDVDGQATTNNDRICTATSCVYYYVSSALASADLESIDADGFTLEWTTTDGGARVWRYLAIGGDDVSAAIKQFSTPGTTGAVAYTGVGFQPDLLIAMTTCQAVDAQNDDHIVGIGIATGTGESQWAIGASNDDNTATSLRNYISYDRGSFLRPPDPGLSATTRHAASLTALGSDGFTLTYVDSDNSSDQVFVLCLRINGGVFTAGEITQPTSTGNQDITTTGITPELVLFVSNGLTAQTDIDDASYSFMFGAANDALEQGVFMGASVDGADPTLTDRYLSDDDAISLWTAGTPTLESEAAVTQMVNNRFRLNWSTADATPRLVGFVAVGSNVGTGGSGGGGGGGQGGQGGQGGSGPPGGGGPPGQGGGGPPGQQKNMVVGSRRVRRRGLVQL